MDSTGTQFVALSWTVLALKLDSGNNNQLTIHGYVLILFHTI
jgi:hypothetical protein